MSPKKAKSNIIEILKNYAKELWGIRAFPFPDSRPVIVDNHFRIGIQGRFIIILLSLLFVFLLICHKFAVLQISEHEQHLNDANKILGFKQKLIGTRGEIYDAENNLLVTNIRTKDLYLTPKIVIAWGDFQSNLDRQKIHDIVEFLAPRANVDVHDLLNRCNELLDEGTNIRIADGIDAVLASKIYKENLKCVGFMPDTASEASEQWIITFSPYATDDDAERDSSIMKLEDALGVERGVFFKKILTAMNLQRPLLVKKNLSIKDAEVIQNDFSEWLKAYNHKKLYTKRIPAASIHFEDAFERFYPKGRLMPNLLGYCDKDCNGLSGIERLMQDELKERTAVRDIVLDGNIKRGNIPRGIYTESLNGYKVHLTIQLPIQHVVESAMARLIEKHKPKYAYIVMMDPHTGAIMALSQYPAYDSLDPSSITSENREFHALVKGYEPGSIMKGITVSAAMDASKLSPDSVIFCENGHWLFAGKYLREHGTASFGDLSVKDIIKLSSNIGSAKAVIENMTEANFYKYLLKYGMGTKTEVGFFPQDKSLQRTFKGESKGLLKPVEKWYKIDISRIAMGHTIMVTPLQMAQAYSAIANKGEMMQPYIIDRIEAPDGTVIKDVPFVKSNPITSKTAAEITECLKGTVQQGGTGTRAKVKGYEVAGKTGTAMKPYKNAQGKFVYAGSKLNTASFIGFVPADNPAFVLLITADEPSGKDQYGGSVCGNTFAEIATETLRILQIPPQNEIKN